MTMQATTFADLPATTDYETVGDRVVPWRVESLETDYSRLRGSAAMIDLSGAGLIAVRGDRADDLVDAAITREVSYMTPDRTIMGLVLGEDARPVDVVTLYRTDDAFIVATSVGRGGLVLDALTARAGDDTEVTDLTGELAAIALEGPSSNSAVGEVLTEPADGLPFQGARTTSWVGGDVVLSRTGVTGEFGFTFLVASDQAAKLWDALTAVAHPVGFEAVEAAMLEVRQPLLNRELLDGDTVVSAGLNWLVDIQKESFVGRRRLLEQIDEGTPTRRVSIVVPAPIGRGAPVAIDGEDVGIVVHAAYSPSLGAHCGVASVRSDVAASGLDITVGGTSGRTVSSPAVTPTSWKALQS